MGVYVFICHSLDTMLKQFMLVNNTTGVISVTINHDKYFFIHEKQETVKHCDTWQNKKKFILRLTPQKCSNLPTNPQQKGFMHHFLYITHI